MKQYTRSIFTLLTSIFLLNFLGGCLVVKAVDTAADIAVGTTKVAVKTTGAVVGAAVPDGDDKDN